jgi:hypothetical protein
VHRIPLFSERFPFISQTLGPPLFLTPGGIHSSRCLHGLGPGQVTQIIFGSGPGSGLVKIIAIKGHIKHFGRSWAIVFPQRKSYSQLRSSYASDTVGLRKYPTDLIPSGIFVYAHLPEIVRDNTLQTWHLISLYCSSNAKTTSDVLRASFNHSFKDYWNFCIKRNLY